MCDKKKIFIKISVRYTVNVVIFVWGLFRDFRAFVFFAKIAHTRKLNPYIFMKEIGVVSWKFPPREMSYQHFREISPSENNQAYST